MTNCEKFFEVFGFKPNVDFCPVDSDYCKEKGYTCGKCIYGEKVMRPHTLMIEHEKWWYSEYKMPTRRQAVDWNIRVDYILERAHEENVAPIYFVYKNHPEWLEVLVPTKDGGVQINYGALEEWLGGGEFE